MVGLDEFAATHNVATRTVRRWLDADRIPGAVKVSGKWSIPAAAVVQDTPGATVATVATGKSGPARGLPTVADILATQPVFVPLEVAAPLLGLSEYVMRKHPDYFGLVRFGPKSSYVMPKARIRDLDGA